MNKKIFAICVFSGALLLTKLFGGVIGSNTTPSVQGATTFPTEDPTNEMRGFAAFIAGVTLIDVNITCLFNDFYPI